MAKFTNMMNITYRAETSDHPNASMINTNLLVMNNRTYALCHLVSVFMVPNKGPYIALNFGSLRVYLGTEIT